jgi:hypothetical protein
MPLQLVVLELLDKALLAVTAMVLLVLVLEGAVQALLELPMSIRL